MCLKILTRKIFRMSSFHKKVNSLTQTNEVGCGEKRVHIFMPTFFCAETLLFYFFYFINPIYSVKLHKIHLFLVIM